MRGDKRNASEKEPEMKRLALTFLAVLALSSAAFAADAQRPVKADCTPQNSPLEVLFGKCHLVKGVALYGQGLENLAGISSGMSPSASVPGM
jgi:opacity protein-like surface antigen